MCNGTAHPLSPRTFASRKAWHRFCLATFPYTTKNPEEARSQLAYSRQQVAIGQRGLVWTTKNGSARSLAAARISLSKHQEAVRRGEEYFRRLEAMTVEQRLAA